MAKKSNSNQAWYKQCTFESPSENGGRMVQTAWIPEKFAEIGRSIYFGKKTDTPERYWTVTSIGGRKSGEYVAAHERDYKTQRKASDI